MKTKLLLVVILATLVVSSLAAEKSSRTRKSRKQQQQQPKVTIAKTATEKLRFLENNEIDTSDTHFKPDKIYMEPRQKPELQRMEGVPLPKDSCIEVKCGAGRVCEVDKNLEPQCVCISECPIETELRRQVCSNHNETWTSDCAVYQQRCWCDTGNERCRGEPYKHIHIEYYGVCRNIPECSKDEMSDFPRRMRDWLFNIMRDMADRRELNSHFLKLEREAETNLTRRWTNAAIWKWCDLDGHPQDRSVSRHELFPIRAPLMSLEHCISPFLNTCDADNDHHITLKEWAICLELDEDEIEDKCDEIAEHQ